MNRRPLLAAVAACVVATGVVHLRVAAATTQEAPTQTQPTFRSGIDVVSLSVTVTDAQGHYVSDLPQEAFGVFEDGVKQDVSFFAKTQTPIALAILMDSSASMDDKLATAQEAAVGFARRLRSEDVAEIIDFDSRVDVRQTFTNDAAKLEDAIRQTSAGGSTSLHNAIYISLKELKKVKAARQDDIRRQAIVVLSDGEDTTSLVSFEEVLDLAKRSETAIYCIGLRGKEVFVTKGFKEADFVLRQLALETGGKAFFPTSASELGNIYSLISEDLANQYTLGYSSKNQKRDGAWRRIVVKVDLPSATARTKQGYYGPTH